MAAFMSQWGANGEPMGTGKSGFWATLPRPRWLVEFQDKYRNRRVVRTIIIEGQ